MPLGRACAAPATYRALADEVSPETARAGTSIALRAMAVLRTARRLSVVEVVTEVWGWRSQCNKPRPPRWTSGLPHGVVQTFRSAVRRRGPAVLKGPQPRRRQLWM